MLAFPLDRIHCVNFQYSSFRRPPAWVGLDCGTALSPDVCPSVKGLRPRWNGRATFCRPQTVDAHIAPVDPSSQPLLNLHSFGISSYEGCSYVASEIRQQSLMLPARSSNAFNSSGCSGSTCIPESLSAECNAVVAGLRSLDASSHHQSHV